MNAAEKAVADCARAYGIAVPLTVVAEIAAAVLRSHDEEHTIEGRIPADRIISGGDDRTSGIEDEAQTLMDLLLQQVAGRNQLFVKPPEITTWVDQATNEIVVEVRAKVRNL